MTRLSCMYCWTLESSSKSGMGDTLYMSSVASGTTRKEENVRGGYWGFKIIYGI